MGNYRHPDPDVWLNWLGQIGKWPEAVRDLGEHYAGCTCYKLKKAHVWLQAYYWNIPGDESKADETDVRAPVQMWVDCLQGRDSIFPGTIVTRVPVEELTHCDCGDWMPPTKEQGELAEDRYKQALMKARRVFN